MTATQSLLPPRRPWVARIVRDRINRPKPDPRTAPSVFMDAVRRADNAQRDRRMVEYLRPGYMAVHRDHDLRFLAGLMQSTVCCQTCAVATTISDQEILSVPHGI